MSIEGRGVPPTSFVTRGVVKNFRKRNEPSRESVTRPYCRVSPSKERFLDDEITSVYCDSSNTREVIANDGESYIGARRKMPRRCRLEVQLRVVGQMSETTYRTLIHNYRLLLYTERINDTWIVKKRLRFVAMIPRQFSFDKGKRVTHFVRTKFIHKEHVFYIYVIYICKIIIWN